MRYESEECGWLAGGRVGWRLGVWCVWRRCDRQRATPAFCVRLQPTTRYRPCFFSFSPSPPFSLLSPPYSFLSDRDGILPVFSILRLTSIGLFVSNILIHSSSHIPFHRAQPPLHSFNQLLLLSLIYLVSFYWKKPVLFSGKSDDSYSRLRCWKRGFFFFLEAQSLLQKCRLPHPQPLPKRPFRRSTLPR